MANSLDCTVSGASGDLKASERLPIPAIMTRVLLAACIALASAVSVEAAERTIRFSGVVQGGQRYEHTIADGFRLVLDAKATGREGWLIRVLGTDSLTDYAWIATPPFHGPNALDLEAWHFRNADNTGPNRGDVNFPQEDREFEFFLTPSDRAVADSALSLFLWPGDRSQASQDSALAVWQALPRGKGRVTITNMKLGNLVRGQRPWFENVQFAVDIQLASVRAAASDEPQLFPTQSVSRCEFKERLATPKDVRLTSRIPVLAEPENWRDAPGPHGERAIFWRTSSKVHGYRILDRDGRVLHVLQSVSLPRWSPDGRWLAVSHWSREHPYQLALVEAGTGKVIPIPEVEHLAKCAWSPDSRKLAFVAVGMNVGWLSVPDTSVHVVARDLNWAFEPMALAWSADSRRFVSLMHREYEHDDVQVTDLWLFGLTPGVCRLTATPEIEEWGVDWLDDRRVIFQTEAGGEAPSNPGTVLELPTSEKR